MGDLVARCRAVGVLVGLTATWPPVLWVAGPVVALPPDTVDSALACALAWLLLACWAWLSLVGGLMTLEAAATGTISLSAHLAPRGLRLLVAAACGAGAVALVAGPAAADPAGEATPQIHLLDGLSLPDRALAAPDRPAPALTSVVVAPGDSLWQLSQRLDLDWVELYRTNRGVIGADPDLILPGTRLSVPSHTHTEGAHR